MKVAYLVNQYPKVSHAFIRREVLALEDVGVPIARYSVRPSTELVDDGDRAEAARTEVLLGRGIARLAIATVKEAVSRPGRFLRAVAHTWRLRRADPTLDFAPGVRMEFRPDGRLRYHVDVGGRDQVIELRYRVEGDLLHTDNPEAPHTMTVRIAHGEADALLLDFAGAQAILVREGV